MKSFLNRSFLTFLVFLPISITQSVLRIGFTASFPPLSRADIFSLIKVFCSRDCYFLRQPRNLLLSSTCDAQYRTGSRARIDVCVDSLFLFWPCGWRKERMCLWQTPKRGSSANDAMKRVGWRSRNPFRARCHMGKPSRIQQKSLLLNDATVFHYCVHLHRAVSRITSLITFKINLLRTDDKVNEYRGTVTVQLSYSCWAVGT